MNPICSTCENRRGFVCTVATTGTGSVNHMTACPIGLFPTDPATCRIAPYRSGSGKRWEGSAPWRNKQVSVILPILEYGETLDLVLECLRRQTIEPIIYIVDTGSISTTDRILALRNATTEVIQLRLQGWYHPSWPVAAALDAVWGCINTPYAFLTHDDCFVKQQDTFSRLIPLAVRHHAVGHQISQRTYPGWQKEFGHTFLMLNVKSMDHIRLTWNMRTWSAITGNTLDPTLAMPNHPDTESMMNLQLHRNQMIPSFSPDVGQPLFLGTEENYERNDNDWFDHCRSLTGSSIYSPEHYEKALKWTKEAMTACRERLATWH